MVFSNMMLFNSLTKLFESCLEIKKSEGYSRRSIDFFRLLDSSLNTDFDIINIAFRE